MKYCYWPEIIRQKKSHVKVLTWLEDLFAKIFPGISIAIKNVISKKQSPTAVHLKYILNCKIIFYFNACH